MIGVPLQLGPLRLASNLMLAPIAGWCDLAWRVTCRSLGGVALACTDLLSPHGLLCGNETAKDLARTNDLDSPICMQLYGPDPKLLAEAARWCADHGATVVDLNMGCPVDKVCKTNAGSKLMCDPAHACRIVEAIRRALPESIPVTVKMRLGWSQADATKNAAGSLACRLIDEGAALITVHGRTARERFKGRCDLQGIARVVESVAEKTGRYDGTSQGGIPVIGNGDVRSPADAIAMMEQTGCAGVMIGRGAFGMPWIFQACWHEQLRKAGRLGPNDARFVEPSEDEKLDIVRRYVQTMVTYRSEAYALPRIRKKISWLGKSINGSHCRPLKDAIRQARSIDEVYRAIDTWQAQQHAHHHAAADQSR